MRKFAVFAVLFILIAAAQSFAEGPSIAPKVIDLARQQWNGDAVCYSGFRAGQNPDLQQYPSERDVLEDLQILSRHWRVIRMYGADPHTATALRVIQRHHLPLKVQLGIWLTGKKGSEAANQQQLDDGIALAKKYRREVAAVSVGNEALVSWSDHAMTEDAMIEAVERVRRAVHLPITVDDDFLYWMKPDAKLVAHVDYIALHIYPVWGNEDIDTAMATTDKLYRQVHAAHPEKTIVIGEAGWPTYTIGEKHAPRAGSEAKQKRYFQEISQWARDQHVTVMVFEAFDEPWKGTGTEGHWGLFSADRKAKPSVLDWYPELKPDHPTSPSYDVAPAPVTK
ncbi:MAG: glycosyl hydrolase family 17 protein [Acidobacteriota bacterium]|nr:glycosyl hydrolase family 17 protein [Acidobacteriota bacterium]